MAMPLLLHGWEYGLRIGVFVNLFCQAQAYVQGEAAPATVLRFFIIWWIRSRGPMVEVQYPCSIFSPVVKGGG
jgi:hypothetical protein